MKTLLKLRKFTKFIRNLLFRRVILVFQMGKVGSDSALRAIQTSLLRDLEGGKPGGVYREIGNTVVIHKHIHRFYKQSALWHVRLGLPTKIICSIREPIARDVSAFFHFYCSPELIENTNLRELEELFLSDSRPRVIKKISRMAVHEFTLNWFDWHFRPLTHIDVYKQPFPIDRKWQIYKRGFLQVLLYRIDLKCSEQAKLVSRFLGIELDEIGPTNRSKDKYYAEHYSRFNKSVKLPESYIRRMHDSRFAKHFWSPAELEVAADKWRVAAGPPADRHSYVDQETDSNSTAPEIDISKHPSNLQ